MKKILFVAFALAAVCVSVLGSVKADPMPINPADGPYYAWTKVRCDVMDNGTQAPGKFCHQLVVETRTQCFFTATVVKDAEGNWQQIAKDPWSLDPRVQAQYCMLQCNPSNPCPLLRRR